MSTAIASGQNRMPVGDSRFTELCGILVALEQFIRSKPPDELRSCVEVQIINDNQGSIQAAQGGSCSESCSAIVNDIQTLAAAHNLNVTFQWQPRDSELMQRADSLTKPKDPTDWHLDRTALTDTVRTSLPRRLWHYVSQWCNTIRQPHYLSIYLYMHKLKQRSIAAPAVPNVVQEAAPPEHQNHDVSSGARKHSCPRLSLNTLSVELRSVCYVCQSPSVVQTK